MSQSFTPTHTSAQSLALMGLGEIKTLQDRILDICIRAQRNGVADLSGGEIQKRYELQYGQRLDKSSISARVNNLVSANRLERLQHARVCQVSGRNIAPVRVPAVQARLAA